MACGAAAVVARWVVGWSPPADPQFLRGSAEPDVFSFHENLWPGGAPGPPQQHSARHPRRPPVMARPRKPGAERRTRMIGVRATTAEAAEIAERAAAARMTKGGYMRRRALGQPVREAAARFRPCAATPNSPASSRSANGSSAAPTRRSTPFRDGSLFRERPAGEGGMGFAHAEPPLCRAGHTEGAGRSRPRPGEADRHRRSAGRGPTPSRPATCGARVPHNTAAFRCTSTPMSNSHLRIGNGLRRTGTLSNADNRDVFVPIDMDVDLGRSCGPQATRKRSGTRGNGL